MRAGPKPVVKFETTVINGALERASMTNEQAASELRVPMSTWYRWKRDGVPAEHVTQLVLLLDLPQPLHLEPETPRAGWAMLSLLRSLAERMDEVERRLDDRDAPPTK